MQDSSHDNCPFKQIEKQELEAKKFGFYWENLPQLIDQIQSECSEVQTEWESKNYSLLEEEIGDLIHATVALAVFCKVDPKKTLQKSIQKFQKRYDSLVQLAKQDGYLQQQPFETLIHYWNQAKILNRK